MKLMLKKVFLIAVLLMVPAVVSAQIDQFGTLDTVYADLDKINDMTWTVTVNYVNDQRIAGLTVPLKIDAGKMNRIVADSAIYTGGRVDQFAFKGFRADTSSQCVTLGMIANLGPTRISLPPGAGRLVTVFISSLDGKPIESLTVDTTTTSPANSLMTVADHIQGDGPNDTLPFTERDKMQIYPAFVVRHAK